MEIKLELSDTRKEFLKQYARVYEQEREFDGIADPIVVVEREIRIPTRDGLEDDYSYLWITEDEENEFFGKTITVAGLITATDLLKQLKGKKLGEELLIPKVMLKSDEDIFLDSITLEDFQERLGTKVRAVDVDGHSFVKSILDI